MSAPTSSPLQGTHIPVWRATRPLNRTSAVLPGNGLTSRAVQLVGDEEWPAVAALADADALAEVLHTLPQVWLPPHTRFTATSTPADTWGPHPFAPSTSTLEQACEMVVVLDDSLAMIGWHATLDAFVELLSAQAFRAVRVYRLDTDVDATDLLLLRDNVGSTAEVPHPASRLAEPGRHRVILVVTDASAAGWRAGHVQHLLGVWGGAHPVALVHLLPQQRWPEGSPHIQVAELRSPTPGAANAPMTWTGAARAGFADDEPGAAPPIPVPVMELGPRWLRTWVRLTSASTWARMPIMLAGALPALSDVSDEASERPPRNAADRVLKILASASPDVLTLATHLAAAPLNVPVMRLVQGVMLPNSTPFDLYEVLTGDLLQPCVSRAQLRSADRITFDFVPGVRQELLSFGDRNDTLQVIRTVGQHLGRRVPAVRHLEDVVETPDATPIPEVTAESAPFLEVEQVVLEALSGRWRSRARQLRDALDRLSRR